VPAPRLSPVARLAQRRKEGPKNLRFCQQSFDQDEEILGTIFSHSDIHNGAQPDPESNLTRTYWCGTLFKVEAFMKANSPLHLSSASFK
jgi:hypothetical protein